MPELNVRKRQPYAAFWYMTLPALLLSSVILSLGLIVVAIPISGTDASCADGVCSSFTLAATIFTLIVAILILTRPILYYLLYTYNVREQSITVNSGILFRQYETISFNKIQAMDNERGPLLMLFGLTLIKIWTASTDQFTPSTSSKKTNILPRPDMRLFLAKDDARILREFVMRSKTTS